MFVFFNPYHTIQYPMTTIPKATSNAIAYHNVASKESTDYNICQTNKNSFDKLFDAVFNSMKVQKLAGSTDLSGILYTIANISNNRKK